MIASIFFINGRLSAKLLQADASPTEALRRSWRKRIRIARVSTAGSTVRAKSWVESLPGCKGNSFNGIL
jgi:hypothetical protein